VTTLAEQIERIQWVLQDTNQESTNLSKIILQHQEAVAALARGGCFPQLVWVQALAGIARYDLPTNTAKIVHVLYDQRALRFSTEASLDRSKPGWELNTGEPFYWSMDNQIPNRIRLIPPPVFDGSATPVSPGLPMMMDLRRNVLVFSEEDVSLDVDDVSDTLPTMLGYDDALVYLTAEALALQEKPEQNLAVAQGCRQLAALWAQFLAK
jgi:hypothetical protein